MAEACSRATARRIAQHTDSAEFQRQLEVLAILGRQSGDRQHHAGHVHALALRQLAAHGHPRLGEVGTMADATLLVNALRYVPRGGGVVAISQLASLRVSSVGGDSGGGHLVDLFKRAHAPSSA